MVKARFVMVKSSMFPRLKPLLSHQIALKSPHIAILTWNDLLKDTLKKYRRHLPCLLIPQANHRRWHLLLRLLQLFDLLLQTLQFLQLHLTLLGNGWGKNEPWKLQKNGEYSGVMAVSWWFILVDRGYIIDG